MKHESEFEIGLIWLGDAKVETNAPIGMTFEEPNPEVFYDE